MSYIDNEGNTVNRMTAAVYECVDSYIRTIVLIFWVRQRNGLLKKWPVRAHGFVYAINLFVFQVRWVLVFYNSFCVYKRNWIYYLICIEYLTLNITEYFCNNNNNTIIYTKIFPFLWKFILFRYFSILSPQ